MSPAKNRWRLLPCLFGVVLLPVCGCSSLGSLAGVPAIPAGRVPEVLTGPLKEDLQQISLSRLRQTPPTVYQLGPGDVLGVYIENVLGDPDQVPPVHFPEDKSQDPAFGYPVTIRDDGSVALPLIPPIDVTGLTLGQVTALVRKAYTVDRKILPEDQDRIMVTLLRRRTYKVLVVREEAGGLQTSSSGGTSQNSVNIGSTKHGTGHVLDLPAYENDLLHALNETGGLPGLDAHNEILIYRGSGMDPAEYDTLVAQIKSSREPCMPPPLLPRNPNVTVIPIRFQPTNPPLFREQDIILNEGDIVMIQARDTEKFYTGGVIPGGEWQLPRDYDVDILEAIAIARGPVASGGSGLMQLGYGGGGGFGGGGGASTGIAPSRGIVLRHLPNGGQIPIRVDLNQALTDPSQRVIIRPGDIIIVQYTFCEELTNAALSLIRFNFLFNGFSGRGF